MHEMRFFEVTAALGDVHAHFQQFQEGQCGCCALESNGGGSLEGSAIFGLELTFGFREERRYVSKSPPCINSMIMKCGSLSRHTPKSCKMCSCLNWLISWASFKKSLFSRFDAPVLRV